MSKLQKVEQILEDYFGYEEEDAKFLLTQDRHAIHTLLREVVERKRNKIVSSLSERKAYNQALDDILTLIDELFSDKK